MSHQRTNVHKNPKKPICIDLILTNWSLSFQSNCVIETGLSDFYKMTISVLKMRFRRISPKLSTYRGFKKFDKERFLNCLGSVLFDPQTAILIHDPDIFFEICFLKKVLDNHALRKKKYISGSHKPFMNKRLSKPVMQQTRFRNKFFKNLTE